MDIFGNCPDRETSNGNIAGRTPEAALPLPVSRAAWILTGGRSSRMGRDKALLEVDAVPLALRVAAKLRRICPEVSLVGDPKLHSALGLRVVKDNFPGAGPLAGIEAALSSTTADWNLIVACDMPALNCATLESLFESGGDCSLPRYADGQLEPLCAVYHRRCHPAILAALGAGVRKVTDALKTLELTYIPVASRLPFANLNTPEDVTKYTHG